MLTCNGTVVCLPFKMGLSRGAFYRRHYFLLHFDECLRNVMRVSYYYYLTLAYMVLRCWLKHLSILLVNLAWRFMLRKHNELVLVKMHVHSIVKWISMANVGPMQWNVKATYLGNTVYWRRICVMTHRRAGPRHSEGWTIVMRSVRIACICV